MKAVSDAEAQATGLPRHYLRACLLLLVAESPAHGYELLAHVSDLGMTKVDTSSLYRTLRALEDEGLVESWWAPAGAGPARRMYPRPRPGLEASRTPRLRSP